MPRLAALVLAILVALPPAARAQTMPETSPAEAPPGAIPSPDLPIPDRDKAASTFVPIPVVFSDPNIGFGGGLMPVFLVHPRRRIDWIFAPSASFNDVIGGSFTSRIYFYPTAQEEFFAFNSLTTEGNLDHSAQFRGRDRLVRGTDLFARGYYIVDGTRRFFGFGADTPEDAESDYELTEVGAEGDFGYRFRDVLKVAGTARFRQTKARGGILDDLPDTEDAFPRLQGLGESFTVIFALGARITFDVRDDPAVPNEGFLADLFYEVSPKSLVSDTRFSRWGGEIVHHLPLVHPGRWVSVVRARYSAIDGDDEFPFWEFPALGGDDTLRGWGTGRFTDKNYLLFSAEQRVRFGDMIIRDNQLVMEVAPFVDVGRVYGGPGAAFSRHHWETVPGVGLRLLLPDSAIVARMDIGQAVTDDGVGPAIFIVLGYPF